MRNPVKSFATSEEGSVGIVFALTTLIVFGMTGLAIDFGRAVTVRTEMQLAADAAAMAAATAVGETETKRREIAVKTFQGNMLNSAAQSLQGGVPITGGGQALAAATAPIVPDVTFPSGGVSVNATAQVQPFLLQLGGISSLRVEAVSTAVEGSAGATSGPACLLALEPSDRGIKINGGGTGSHITANCGVYANSSSGSAIFGNDKGTITSSYTCVVGDYDRSPTYTPTPTRNCAVMADPFAGRLTAPASSTCSHDNKKVDKKKPETLSPGVYCGGIDIASDADVTFSPGVYVIKNGQFKIGSSAKARGDGVFFYLTGNNSRFLWTSHSEVEFKAPSTGTWKGMLLWSDNSLSNAHEVGCHAQSIIQGAVYSPNTEIQIGSSGDVGASADWTVWVVKSIEMSSHAHLKITANHASSATPMPDGLLSRITYSPKVVRLR